MKLPNMAIVDRAKITHGKCTGATVIVANALFFTGTRLPVLTAKLKARPTETGG